MGNPNVELTLDDAVAEVLGLLTGLDLTYSPQEDRYRSITMQINRALRSNALDWEWSYYSSLEEVGTVHTGDVEMELRSSIRPRIIGGDAVRLVDSDGKIRYWAYFLPREHLHANQGRTGLWCAVTRSTLQFSKPLGIEFDGMTVNVPVMREPIMLRLPPMPQGLEDGEVPELEDYADVRAQTLDFDYPDVVVLRAAYYYSMSDPVMQPRSQTLEKEYKDLMYSLTERDKRNTDAPFLNDFVLPIGNSIDTVGGNRQRRPSSDGRRF